MDREASPPQFARSSGEAGLVREWLIRDKYHGKISEGELENDLAHIAKGEPADYVIGSREFLGAHIDLSMRPLIPREATEYWVEKAIAEIEKDTHGEDIHILDLFSGSGAIGIALLKHLPLSCVDFGEIDVNLVKQIALNLELNNIDASRFKVIETDVFSNISDSYDYILANPPYLSRERLHEVQRSVLDYEPHRALFGDEEGMEFLAKLFTDAPKFLAPGGAIYFEFHSPQKERIEKLLGELGYQFELYKDQFDQYRWGRAQY